MSQLAIRVRSKFEMKGRYLFLEKSNQRSRMYVQEDIGHGKRDC